MRFITEGVVFLNGRQRREEENQKTHCVEGVQWRDPQYVLQKERINLHHSTATHGTISLGVFTSRRSVRTHLYEIGNTILSIAFICRSPVRSLQSCRAQ
jgi:hypothetical protein